MAVLLRGRTLVQAIRPASSVSSVHVSPAVEVDTNENEIVSPEFTNRNPRNLESLSLAVKDRGWGTVWPSRAYWHRLRLERTGYNVTALVEHANGNIVLSASTTEWCVKKHLQSTKGVTACENVGRVLAQRCLEAGIHYMLYKEIPWVFRSKSVQQFRKAMVEGGILLTEPPRIYQ